MKLHKCNVAYSDKLVCCSLHNDEYVVISDMEDVEQFNIRVVRTDDV